MYFFKQQKLSRLYKKQEDLTAKLSSCSNKAKKVVLEAKLTDVNFAISSLEHDIKYKRKR